MTWLIILIALALVATTSRLFVYAQSHDDEDRPPMSVEENRQLADQAGGEDFNAQMAAIREINHRGGLKDPRMVLALAESPLGDHAMVQAAIMNALKKCAGPGDVEQIRESAAKLRDDPPIKHEVEIQRAREFAGTLDAYANELQARAKAGQWGVVEVEGEGNLSQTPE